MDRGVKRTQGKGGSLEQQKPRRICRRLPGRAKGIPVRSDSHAEQRGVEKLGVLETRRGGTEHRENEEGMSCPLTGWRTC